MDEKFYLIRRNDGYVFIQRYVPGNYADTTFEVISVHNSKAAVILAAREIGAINDYFAEVYEARTSES